MVIKKHFPLHLETFYEWDISWSTVSVAWGDYAVGVKASSTMYEDFH